MVWVVSFPYILKCNGGSWGSGVGWRCRSGKYGGPGRKSHVIRLQRRGKMASRFSLGKQVGRLNGKSGWWFVVYIYRCKRRIYWSTG